MAMGQMVDNGAEPRAGNQLGRRHRLQSDQRTGRLLAIGTGGSKEGNATDHRGEACGLDKIMMRQVMLMPLAFSASQHLALNVQRDADRLPDYLHEDDRLVGALLDSRQLTPLEPGRYRYVVTSLQVFQLHVKPIVSLEIVHEGNTVLMRAVDCELEGLGMVENFDLTLEARLQADADGLSGTAALNVQVSQPPLLRLIPKAMLESTGESILNGILLGIKGRVGQQLITDFNRWCQESERETPEKTAAMENCRP